MAGIDPITMGIGAGLQGAMGLGKMIAGGIQARRGKKDLAVLEANRPVYERPQEVTQAGNISRLRYLNPNMPGQSLMEQKVGQQQANTLQNIQDMGGVADIYQTQINANNAMNDIGVQAASQRLQNEMNLLNQLAVEADYSDKEFDTNTYIPWQENRKSALDRIGAGTQNLFGGMDNLASMGVGFMGMAGGNKASSGNSTASQLMNLANSTKQAITPLMSAQFTASQPKTAMARLMPLNPTQEVPIDRSLNRGLTTVSTNQSSVFK